MKRSITPNQIKQNNRNLIYHYIYKNGKYRSRTFLMIFA